VRATGGGFLAITTSGQFVGSGNLLFRIQKGYYANKPALPLTPVTSALAGFNIVSAGCRSPSQYDRVCTIVTDRGTGYSWYVFVFVTDLQLYRGDQYTGTAITTTKLGGIPTILDYSSVLYSLKVVEVITNIASDRKLLSSLVINT
jgi:hypothetical protein